MLARHNIGCVLTANSIAMLVHKIRSAEVNFCREGLLMISRNEPPECYTYSIGPRGLDILLYLPERFIISDVVEP